MPRTGLGLKILLLLVNVGAFVGCGQFGPQVPPIPSIESGTAATDKLPAVTSSAELDLANEFARRAAAGESKEALALIDRQRFTERLMSTEGSYQAQAFQLSAEQLLEMIGQYPLDGTTTFHNRRFWQVLGKSSFGGRQGVVLRYYSEPRSAIQVLDDFNRCQQVASKIPLDEFERIAGNLFAATERSASAVKGIGGEIKLDIQVVPKSLGILPPRIGYVLLLIDDAGGKPVIYDFVDIVSRQALSSTAGVAYQHEWTLRNAYGEAHPELHKISSSFFGPIPLKLGENSVTREVEDIRFLNGATVTQPPSKFPGRSDIRAIRLYEVVKTLRFAPAETAAKVKQFKADFPADTGADMAIVIISLIQDKISIAPQAAEQVSESAGILYGVFNDPLLLAVQGFAEVARNQPDVARSRFEAAHQSGFESVATHEFFVLDALRRDDTEGLKTTLANLAKFWGNHNETRNVEVYDKYAGRWKQHERSRKPPEPSLADRMKAGQSTAGPEGNNPGPRGGNIGPYGRGSGMQGTERIAGPGPIPGTTPSTGERERSRLPPSAPADPSSKVTIQLTIMGPFDINASVTKLRDKVAFNGYNTASSGGSGSITIQYAGAVKDVADAIGFGKVTSTDESQRIVNVTVE